jgi:putative ABC transport system substrate-binding protein
MIQRREFIVLLGGAAAWPLAARAQQPTMPVVGFLSSASPAPFAHLVAGLRRGLQDAGFVEGRNVAGAPAHAQAGTKERASGTNKGTA